MPTSTDPATRTNLMGQQPVEHWSELRLASSAPDRRSYHSTFVYDQKMYVMGGLDIQNGTMSSLWELDLANLHSADEEVNDEGDGSQRDAGSSAWQLVNTAGAQNQRPGSVAYHTSVVYRDQMFLFGGNNYKRTVLHYGEDIHYQPLFSLNLRTFTWQAQKTRGDVVRPRDEHTAVVDEENSLMVIFGGFEEGERTNSVAIYNMKTNIWQAINLPEQALQPCPRSGHAAAFTDGTLYVMGGKDSDSNKLNDLWSFNLKGQFWTQLQPDTELPCIRSGHSMCAYDGNLVVFGGIIEVTKELNDLWGYCLSSNKWSLI